MENTPSLQTSTIVIHPEHGKGVIICNYTDDTLGDMVEVHWQSLNIIMEHRVDSLRKQLTSTQFQDKRLNHWAMLADEDR
jgi:hypothetical protein